MREVRVLPILVINLDRDEERLVRMRSELGRFGLAFERLPAVRGVALPPEMAERFLLSEGASPTLTRGELGCYASHLTAMELVVRNGWPAAVVMEDDLEIGSTLPAALEALERWPEPWDMVRIATQRVKTAVVPVAKIAPGLDVVRYWRIPFGTGAYAISQAGARKFLDWVSARPITRPVDVDFARDWDCGLTTYGLAPAPARQDVFDASSIDDAGGKRARREGAERKLEPLLRAAHNFRTLGRGPFMAASAANIRARLSKSYRRRLAERIGA